VSLAANQAWTCDALSSAGFASPGTYTYWADWLDSNGNWHRGELGPEKTFTLQTTAPIVQVAAPSSPPPLAAGSSVTVAAPVAPGAYTVPAGATVVSTSAQLINALAGTAKNIVLADGTYDSASPFRDTNSTGLYAQHPGKAVLTAGLVVGGNFSTGGAVVRGLSFDISDPTKVFQSAEIQNWGNGGYNTQVLDCTFEGHGVIPVGLRATNVSGLVAQRLVFSHFTDEGIRASENATVPYGTATPTIDTISDISVDGVSRSTPGSSSGTAEAGLWIGHPVTNGVRRIRIRNVSSTGIETVSNSWDTTFSDLDIDMSGPNQVRGVGVYMEHFTLGDTFTNFLITGAMTGFNAEWNDNIAGNAAAHNVTITNGTIDATGSTAVRTAGVYLDEGTDSTTITNVTFKNQNWAGIGAFRIIGNNVFSGNTFQLGPGAVQISPGHI